MLMMTLRKKQFPPLLLSLFFSCKEKSHAGIENLPLAIGRMKFKSKQRGGIVIEQLHYFLYSALSELNSEALKDMAVKMQNHHH